MGRPPLAEALCGEANLPALKVELHRLREALGTGLASRPYRLTLPLSADFLELKARLQEGDLPGALALYKGPLLPASQSPGIEELRLALEADLRETVLATRNPGLLLMLAEHLPKDLEAWEALRDTLPQADSRFPAVPARVRRLRTEYGLE